MPKPPTPSKDKKKQFKEHDPYALPNLDVAAAIDKVANAGMGPDHRFATDEELRNFIDEIHPEDLSNMSSLGIDVTSSDFRSLPTDVQYEIIGDLRLKSRQTSYARLDMMLKAAPTPMDFSRQQIKFLKQRNDLTQQLLMTTDNIGTKATIDTQIPVRIASERNKQYVLVKNHGKDGGWILGVKKDEGTLAKPITIDHDSAEEETDGDMDMEEVTMCVKLRLRVDVDHQLIVLHVSDLTEMHNNHQASHPLPQQSHTTIPTCANTAAQWLCLPSQDAASQLGRT